MKMKSVVLLAVALGCGLVAMLGVQQVLTGDEAVEGTAQVLVATAEIPPGVPLDETNTGFKQVSDETVAEGVYVTNAEQFKERALKAKAFPGEMIMLAKLGEKGIGGISLEIPVGMRVITVKCDATMILSGMIRPGDRVDVLVTFRSQDRNRRTVTKTRTVLEYIKVFAADSMRDPQGTGTPEIKAKNISFLVTPEQAQVLKLAEDRGNLHLSLRSITDTKPMHVATFSERDLDGTSGIGEADPDDGSKTEDVREFVAREEQSHAAEPEEAIAAEPVPEKQMWTIHIYAGGEHREEQVELPEEAAAAAATKPFEGWLNKFFKG